MTPSGEPRGFTLPRARSSNFLWLNKCGPHTTKKMIESAGPKSTRRPQGDVRFSHRKLMSARGHLPDTCTEHYRHPLRWRYSVETLNTPTTIEAMPMAMQSAEFGATMIQPTPAAISPREMMYASIVSLIPSSPFSRG
jgi:hypothetical protein